jgi:hypothetical protein
MMACSAAALIVQSATAQVIYMYDDGTSEATRGEGAEYLWGQHFQRTPTGGKWVGEIEVAFGDSGIHGGETFHYALYTDPNLDNDLNPVTGSLELLYTGSDQVVVMGGTGNDAFQSVSIPTQKVGEWFFVSIVMETSAADPAKLDETQPVGKSYYATFTATGTWTAADPFAGAAASGVVDSGGGNWLVRINTIPSPSVLAAIGMGSLVVSRRRR